MSALPPLPSRDELLQMPQPQAIDLLLEYITRLGGIVEQLQTRLATDSTTSSRPPSADLLTKPESPKPKPEGEPKVPKRKPGAQPGHQGKTRKGFGTPDRLEAVSLGECPQCGGRQWQTLSVEARQVACFAERPLEIVEFRRPTGCCTHCRSTHTPKWPSRLVGHFELDATLMAVLSWLGHYGHLSLDKQAEFVESLCGWRPAVGTLAAVKERTALAVAASVQAAWQHLATEAVVYVDETPWPVAGCKEWLWHFGSERLSLFHAGQTRSRLELRGRLGERFCGTLVSDDFSAYNGYQVQAQQKCLAHLRRHFKKLALHPAEPAGIGAVFIELIDEAFKRYRQWQQDGDSASWQSWGQQFRVRVEQAIRTWQPKAAYAGSKLLRSLQERAGQWWQFLSNPAVRPDNNLSERNLRLAVTRRKVSGGSRSQAGYAQTADLLSVIQSCRRQGRSAMEFFVRALQATYHGGFAQPSLIPETST
ncbi:IS66 family transposase [Gloeobacter kilaueensis]|uniref:Transposase n=1 Tax=Gloeobacter kilaueensis (strain ATCC BAA-2537 / CCAP 1431/1 / ULC 316 / JS1) TaxID=1183438 RepID=U5QK93_GLOK1|nr:IS66 family transposase [Gloeobacter kilaueensis]AGY57936.1 transposase [Gloeobacter kilaueensis JS1]AGY58533.1 transposase [Gloeobacter kilaueensis JS1]AGY59298.1 transposase [Gloeobacter kilaueensis JS1]